MASRIGDSPKFPQPSTAAPKRKLQTTIEQCFKKARSQEPKIPLRDRPTVDECMRELLKVSLDSSSEDNCKSASSKSKY